MPLDYQTVRNWPFEPVAQTYTERDTILYALGLGVGANPTAGTEVRFTFEEAAGFAALPTLPVVLGSPGFWVREPDSTVDWTTVLHGEQGLRIHAPIPSAARIIATNRVAEVIDKGADRGALIYLEREIRDATTGTHLATTTSTTFARRDGGFGGPSGPVKPVHTLPDRAPDAVHAMPVLPQAALIYRLSGDPNPLHASPDVAASAGFEAPILHGLCTFGIAGWAILQSVCGGDPARLRAMDLRFSAPVYPGETVTTEIWQDAGQISFRARVGTRTVLNNGKAAIDV